MSSWTLHDALGRRWNELDADGRTLIPRHEPAPAALDLLDLPAEISAHGIDTFDLCHFHLPSIDSGYLAELRSALEGANVELVQLLIDSGAVGQLDPEGRRADIERTRRWMEVASELGATGVRYVPGDGVPSPEAIRVSAEAFRELADCAAELGLEPATENFKAMNKNADDLLRILELSERDYGLVADFGNASGPDKYETLARLLPRANSIHAWAECAEDGTLDAEEFRRCLRMAGDAGFEGPILLLGGRPPAVFRRTRDLWSGTAELRDEVRAVFGDGV